MKKIVNIFKGDKVIWIIYILFTLISLVAVYSAIGRTAVVVKHTSPISAWGKHVMMIVAGYIIAICVSNIKYIHFGKIARILFWVSIGLLVYVLVFCSNRWIYIPVFGSFQPSELAKIALIAYLANMLAVNQDQLDNPVLFLKAIGVTALTAFFILPENFSTAALIVVVCMVVLFFSGINRKYWWRTTLVIVVIAAVGLTVAVSSYRNGATGDGLFGRAATWGHRVDTWLHPNPDDLTQENMARMAIASGGFVRVAIGHTVHARLMTQAENDFIYAIIIEETGMVAGIIVLLLYTFLCFRCVKNAWRCTGLFGALMLVGYGTLIYLQAVLNMAVAVGVMPVTGQTLPLISSGGTAYLMMSLAIGIIQSVSYDTLKEEKLKKDKIRSDKEFEELKILNAKING